MNTTTKKRSTSLLVFASIFIFGLISFSCSKKENNTLYLFNWTYYTPDSVIEQFEQEFGVTVKVDSYASNEEMYAKLMAGASGYDIVFPSQDYTSIMLHQNMFQKLDHTKIPNMKYINPTVLKKATYDSTMDYSVPYYMGAAGIAVNKTKVAEYEKSWSIFNRSDLTQRMSMLDDMREVIGDALAVLGKNTNSLDDADLAAAQDLIINGWKPQLVKFDAEGFGKSFAAGNFWVVQGYAEVVYGEVPEEKWDTIDFFIPKEGGPMYIDSMCILKKAKNPELAHKFINFIHRPEIYAQFLDTFRFPASVNLEAKKYMKTKPMYQAEEMNACTIKEDLGAGLEKYNEIWQKIRFTD